LRKLIFAETTDQKGFKMKETGIVVNICSYFFNLFYNQPYRYVNPRYVKCGCENDSNKLLF